MSIILDSEELKNWAKELLIPRLIRTLDYGDGEEGSFHLSTLPSNLVGFRERFKLLAKTFSEIWSCQWSHSSGLLHRISERNLRQSINKSLSKGFIVIFVDDESLWREANLSSIGASSSQSKSYSFINVTIIEYNERIISTEFHNCSLKVFTSLLSNESSSF